MKRPVSFKNNDNDIELEKWIMEESKVIGFSSYMKQLAYEKKKEMEQNSTNKKPENNKQNCGMDYEFDF